MMTLLPALLLAGRRLGDEPVVGGHSDRRERIERLWLARPGWVMGFTVLTCIACLCMFGRIRFDYNLLNMQSDGLPAVEFEQLLLEAGVRTDAAPKSLLYGV